MMLRVILTVTLLSLGSVSWSGAKGGTPFNPFTDIHYEEIELTFLGFCLCKRGPFTVTGLVWTYWEPYVAIDTTATPFYSPFLGIPFGGSTLSELRGSNSSQDGVNTTNESTFSQAHVFPIPLMNWLPLFCSRYDYPFWLTEYDPQWQLDELSMLIHPEAMLYASLPLQTACTADAAATNAGSPLDSMPWCIGSGGSSYPMTGHVDNDNLVQANNTAAARLIYKLNRLGLICDTAMSRCGCEHTPTWFKSHYKTHVVRPGDRSPAWPLGVTASYYNSGLNQSFTGSLGSSDEFLWIIYRRQLCCTCCD